jgi:hypothetical protein
MKSKMYITENVCSFIIVPSVVSNAFLRTACQSYTKIISECIRITCVSNQITMCVDRKINGVYVKQIEIKMHLLQ